MRKVVVLSLSCLAVAAYVAAQCPPGPRAKPVPPAVEMQPMLPPVAKAEPAQGPVVDAAKKLLLKMNRSRALNKCVSDGVTVPGGGKLKLTRDEAMKVMAEIDDDLILAHVAEKYG